MNRARNQVAAALLAGVVFGAGLATGGMTNPRKVIAFLDVSGAWDPSLALVMVGAVAVHFLAYRWVLGSAAPLFADEFSIPKLRQIDPKLVAGAAIFGAGWGIGGYCPGPGIVSLGAGRRDAVVFVAMMMLGWLLTAKYEAWTAAGASRSSTRAPSGEGAAPR
jgi:uncharacterized membrane protein YedE/YeeE